MSDMIRLAGLWVRSGPKGKFMAGNVHTGMSLLIFKNSNKQNETDPEYVAFLAPSKPQQQGQGQRGATQQRTPPKSKAQLGADFRNSKTHATPPLADPAEPGTAPPREPGDESETTDDPT